MSIRLMLSKKAQMTIKMIEDLKEIQSCKDHSLVTTKKIMQVQHKDRHKIRINLTEKRIATVVYALEFEDHQIN